MILELIPPAFNESTKTISFYQRGKSWTIFPKLKAALLLEDQPASMELDKVLFAMSSHAQDCRGQKGLRYIASAIVACHERGQSLGEGIVELKLLESMAITQFLFICAYFLFFFSLFFRRLPNPSSS